MRLSILLTIGLLLAQTLSTFAQNTVTVRPKDSAYWTGNIKNSIGCSVLSDYCKNSSGRIRAGRQWISPSVSYRGWAKFDLSAVSIPSNATITDLNLKVYTTDQVADPNHNLIITEFPFDPVDSTGESLWNSLNLTTFYINGQSNAMQSIGQHAINLDQDAKNDLSSALNNKNWWAVGFVADSPSTNVTGHIRGYDCYKAKNFWRSYYDNPCNDSMSEPELEITYDTSSTTIATPTFDPPDGTSFTPPDTSVTITSTSGANIYYTTDGSTPNLNSQQYSSSITISSNTTIKAIAYKNGKSSSVATATYTKIFNNLTADFSTIQNPPFSPPQTIDFVDQSFSPNSSITQWNWDFGDGNTSNQQNPTHTYQNSGKYTVELTVSNQYGSNTETKNNYINVGQTQPAPNADFTANPTIGNEPLTVNFTDQSSNNPTSWSWDFGDGNTSNQQNPTHTYQNNGTYTVTLTVSNSQGSDSETKNSYIVVNDDNNNNGPTAQFSAQPKSGNKPLTVNFTDQSSNNPTSWSWDFGDDNTSNQQNPTHTYQNQGTYTVTLTVSNSQGSDSITKTKLINVNGGGLTADFTAQPTQGFMPLTVNFLNQTTNDPEVYLWEFGDGAESTKENPTHTYKSGGSYNVKLTVSKQGSSDSIVKQNFIAVITGIQDIPSINIFQLYPNPTQNKINLELRATTIQTLNMEIHNATGQVVYEDQLNDLSGKYQKSISLEEESKGIYFLRLSTEEGQIKRNVILK